eukprot:5188391-Pleurochrysis_carterae.AAC.1
MGSALANLLRDFHDNKAFHIDATPSAQSRHAHMHALKMHLISYLLAKTNNRDSLPRFTWAPAKSGGLPRNLNGVPTYFICLVQRYHSVAHQLFYPVANLFSAQLCSPFRTACSPTFCKLGIPPSTALSLIAVIGPSVSPSQSESPFCTPPFGCTSVWRWSLALCQFGRSCNTDHPASLGYPTSTQPLICPLAPL